MESSRVRRAVARVIDAAARRCGGSPAIRIGCGRGLGAADLLVVRCHFSRHRGNQQFHQHQWSATAPVSAGGGGGPGTSQAAEWRGGARERDRCPDSAITSTPDGSDGHRDQGSTLACRGRPGGRGPAARRWFDCSARRWTHRPHCGLGDLRGDALCKFDWLVAHLVSSPLPTIGSSVGQRPVTPLRWLLTSLRTRRSIWCMMGSPIGGTAGASGHAGRETVERQGDHW